MAELHIIGHITKAIEFEEPKLVCNWRIQAGASWKTIEGVIEGCTIVATDRLEESQSFVHPIDVHLAFHSIRDWPKIYVEVRAINALNQSWPVGFGFVHIPPQPGLHCIEVTTWKVAPLSTSEKIREKFLNGGFDLTKTDVVCSGNNRYKLLTESSGKIGLDLMLIFRNFSNFGIELT